MSNQATEAQRVADRNEEIVSLAQEINVSIARDHCVHCEQHLGDDDFTFTADDYLIHKSCYRSLVKEEAARKRKRVRR